MTETTGGAIVAAMLAREGVDTFFGIVDGTYTQLYANCVERGMRMISPRHESIAAHMAGAWARLTGRLGVCLASNGPGVANVLPGVAVENGEGNRVLLLTSSRRTGITHPDRGGGYQCFDQVAVIRPMTRWSQTVPSFERIPELLRAALRAAWAGRPGVVHLDIPENLINGAGPEPTNLDLGPDAYRILRPPVPSPEEVERCVSLLERSRLPLIHAGSGVIHARAFDPLRRLAEELQAPVSTSWAARGVLDERHPLAWPMIHVEACNRLRREADLVLCLGSDLGETDWWAKPPYWGGADQRWLQVDVDPTILGRNRPLELGLLADVGRFLEMLLEALDGRRGDVAARRARLDELARDKTAHRSELDGYLKHRASPMITAHVGAACREVLDDDAVMVFDGGNSAVWGHYFSEIRCPDGQLATAHFGHLGAGVGQALGAAVALPERQVCCILGDGAMAFQMQEIETAVRHDLRPLFVVCADRQWGMVKLTQKLSLAPMKESFTRALGPEGDRSINTDLGEIAWDRAAEAMGGHGERISHPDDLVPALRRCLDSGRCSVLHVDVDAGAHLMAPGLIYFKAMHEEPAGA